MAICFCVGASVVLHGGTLHTVDAILHIGVTIHDVVLHGYRCTICVLWGECVNCGLGCGTP
jgi:hypothetical protein